MSASISRPTSHRSFWMLIGLNALFYAIVQLPLMSYLMVPLTTFVTTLHEFGHASACFATGGGVDALTIVSDGNGHAGLTYCRGGWPLFSRRLDTWAPHFSAAC